MHCPSCGFENPQGMKFCGECGTPLAGRCPQCGFANPPQFKFCGDCGAPLSLPAPALPPALVLPLSAEPVSYTPGYLAEKILASRSALEGERKQVTVLFADLKGSMELLADRDPEEARQLLDPVLERMMAAVHRYEGTVNQVMGDGIMALFGAPIAHEDHAVRACYAALAMQEAIRRYSEELHHAHGLEVQIRVGLNSGEVVVRAIGNDLHMDYSAIGQTTHLAARMEQLATPGSILLTAETLWLVKGLVEAKPLGPTPVKGLSHPVAVFELAGPGPIRMRMQALAVRELTRFVGRQTEIETLRQAQERAEAGQGQVVAVIGEPGVGKTRLFYEFLRSRRTQSWLLLESSSVSYGKAVPYLPISSLLKAYFQIEGQHDARQLREKIIGKLRALAESLMPMLPAFLTLLDVPIEDREWQALDPSQRRQQTLDALKHLLLCESQVQPLLVLFENLHWIDTETQALLDSLVESLPMARLLLLVNYRPEYHHTWGSKTYYTQLRLDPLPPPSVESLLQGLLGQDVDLEPLKRVLIARTEGNPFFLEESVRTLVETGTLVGEPGAYSLVQTPPAIQVPVTVQVVLAARIDRLRPEDKRLLQTAAVLGTEVSLPLLQAIAEVPEDALHRSLAHLQASEFLYETHLFPERVYTFKHALTQEVAYASLLQERRHALHARIGDIIEILYADCLTTQLEHLAYHAFRGEAWEKAVIYCRQAGLKMVSRSAYREAVTYFEQALLALQQLPENTTALQQAFDLRMELTRGLVPLADYGSILAHLRGAEAIAEAQGDRRRLALVCSHMTDYFRLTGHSEQAVACGERALVFATELGDFSLWVLANQRLGHACHAVGDYRRSVQLLKENIVMLQGERSRQRFGAGSLPSVLSRSYLIFPLVDLGEFAEAIAMGEEAIQIADEADTAHSQVLAAHAVGFTHLCKGDVDRAIPLLQHTLRRCQVEDMPLNTRLVTATLGYAYTLTRQTADAMALLERGIQQTEALNISFRYALWLAWLGEAYLLAGRMDQAFDLAKRALNHASTHKEPGHQAYALRLLGELHAYDAPPDVDQAEIFYRQALALAIKLGMRPLQAHCQRGLGSLYAKVGWQEPARAELSTAIELYRVMEMTLWLPQAEAMLAQVEGW
jgi:class 3 adenylate cyclase/tetratricopeptide (TPR) repeat protein